MDWGKAAGIRDRICDFLEVWIPCICFVILFATYIILIVYRYILHLNIAWMNELSNLAYLWTAVFALSYSGRKKTDVTFTILYDRCHPAVRRIMRIIGNALVSVLLTITIPYVYRSIQFLSIRRSSIMKIPFNIIYAPFLVFMILEDLYCIEAVVKELVSLFRKTRHQKR